MRNILLTIIVILLILISIATRILIIETQKKLENMDYTIYTFEPQKVYYPSTEEYTPILKNILDFYQDIKKPRKYKYYKKLELVNYCNCDECRFYWQWGIPSRAIPLIPEYTVAANPKIFAVGTHIKTSKSEFMVYFTDERIPENKIYVYVKQHDRNNKTLYNGIWDVYKEKIESS